MAKAKGGGAQTKRGGEPHRRTSIGSSVNTRPKNKHTRASFKVYRGQGR